MSTPQAEFRKSALLEAAGFVHAFFTRQGGVSTGKYASLNFAANTGDLRENVSENLQRAAAVLGVGAARIFFLSQVHGHHVVQLDGSENAAEIALQAGDAIQSASPNLACAVRSADCVPILIADTTSGAVAAVHAGWRGIVQNIIGHAVTALRGDTTGHKFIAAIGPHISQAAFEVGDDVAAELAGLAPHLNVVERAHAKPHVDLRRLAQFQLECAGIQAVDQVWGCTLLEPEQYFSYRRDGAHSGRHLSAIVPRSTH